MKYIFIVLICCPLFVCGQQKSLEKENLWSLSLMAGNYGNTDYITETGEGELLTWRSRALGISAERRIASFGNFNLSLGTTVRVELAMTGTYGVNYPFEHEFPFPWPYAVVGEGIETWVVDIPLALDYEFALSENTSIIPNAKIMPSIYTAIKDYEGNQFWLGNLDEPNPQGYLAYTIRRDFEDWEEEGDLAISPPKLEYELGFKVKRDLNTYGAISLGALYHFGTRNLSTGTFSVMEHEPELATTGRYEWNNSFYALTLGFDLVRHIPKDKRR